MDLWRIKSHTPPKEKRAPHIFVAELKDGDDYTFTLTDEALNDLIELTTKLAPVSVKK